ncbi:hypothetical protein Tco_1532249 [Tanacetum coccineum]
MLGRMQEIRLGKMQNPGIQNVENQNGLIVVPRVANQNGNGSVVAARDEVNVRPRRRDTTYLQTQLLIAQKEEARIQLQAEEFDLMTDVAKNEEIKEGNANCILMDNFQQVSTSDTHVDKAPNDSNVIPADSSMDPSGGIVEQHPATIEETRYFHESLYNNLVIGIEKFNTVNCEIREVNVKLTAELAIENLMNLKMVIENLFIKKNVLVIR